MPPNHEERLDLQNSFRMRNRFRLGRPDSIREPQMRQITNEDVLKSVLSNDEVFAPFELEEDSFNNYFLDKQGLENQRILAK